MKVSLMPHLLAMMSSVQSSAHILESNPYSSNCAKVCRNKLVWVYVCMLGVGACLNPKFCSRLIVYTIYF